MTQLDTDVLGEIIGKLPLYEQEHAELSLGYAADEEYSKARKFVLNFIFKVGLHGYTILDYDDPEFLRKYGNIRFEFDTLPFQRDSSDKTRKEYLRRMITNNQAGYFTIWNVRSYPGLNSYYEQDTDEYYVAGDINIAELISIMMDVILNPPEIIQSTIQH